MKIGGNFANNPLYNGKIQAINPNGKDILAIKNRVAHSLDNQEKAKENLTREELQTTPQEKPSALLDRGESQENLINKGLGVMDGIEEAYQNSLSQSLDPLRAQLEEVDTSNLDQEKKDAMKSAIQQEMQRTERALRHFYGNFQQAITKLYDKLTGGGFQRVLDDQGGPPLKGDLTMPESLKQELGPEWTKQLLLPESDKGGLLQKLLESSVDGNLNFSLLDHYETYISQAASRTSPSGKNRLNVLV